MIHVYASNNHCQTLGGDNGGEGYGGRGSAALGSAWSEESRCVRARSPATGFTIYPLVFEARLGSLRLDILGSKGPITKLNAQLLSIVSAQK